MPPSAARVLLLALLAVPVLSSPYNATADETSLIDVCTAALDAWQAADLGDSLRALANATSAAGGADSPRSQESALAAALAQQATRLEQLLERCSNATGAAGGVFTTSSDLAGDGGPDAGVLADAGDAGGATSLTYTQSGQLCIRNIFPYAIHVWCYPFDDNEKANWDWPSRPDNVYGSEGGGSGVTIAAGGWDCRRLEVKGTPGYHAISLQISQDAGVPDTVAPSPGPGGKLFDVVLEFDNTFMLGNEVKDQAQAPNSYFDRPMSYINVPHTEDFYTGPLVYINSDAAAKEQSPGMVFNWKSL